MEIIMLLYLERKRLKFKEAIDELLTEEYKMFDIDSLHFFARQRGERTIPHIHFISKDETIKGAIRLDIAEYYIHDIYRDILPKKLKIKFNEKIHEGNNWLLAVETWNSSVPEGNKIFLPKDLSKVREYIPDYLKL